MEEEPIRKRGRPAGTRTAIVKLEMLSLRMPRSRLAQLRAYAWQHNYSLSALIREGIALRIGTTSPPDVEEEPDARDPQPPQPPRIPEAPIMRVSQETITPQRAQEYLDTQSRNRKVRASHVATLAKAMQDGTFLFSGDPIRFSRNGALIDGQHRLLACIESGIPLVALVITGLTEDTQSVIDTGIKRTPGDIFGLLGYANANTLSATLRWLWRFDHGFYTSYPRRPQVSELEDTFRRHPGVEASLTPGQNCARLLLKSLGAALYTLCAEQHPRETTQFFKKLQHGDGLFRGEPLYLLRTRLVRNSASKAKLLDYEMAALTIKAFNAYITGRRLNSLRWGSVGAADEPFPTIL